MSDAASSLLNSQPNTINFVQAVFRHFNGEAIFDLCETWLSGDLWILSAAILSVTYGARLGLMAFNSMRGQDDHLIPILIDLVTIILVLSMYKLLMGWLAVGFEAIKDFFPMGDVKILAAKLDAMINKGWDEIPIFATIGEDGILYWLARGVYVVTNQFSIAFLLIFEIGHAMVYSLILVLGYILIPIAFVSRGLNQLTKNWGLSLLIVMLWPVVDVVLIKMLAGMFFNLINDPSIKIEGNGLPGMYMALMAFSIVNVLICVVVYLAPVVSSKLIAGNGDLSTITRPFSLAALGAGAAAAYAGWKTTYGAKLGAMNLSTRAAENMMKASTPEAFNAANFKGTGFKPPGGGVAPGASSVKGFVGDPKPASQPMSFGERPHWPSDAEIANPTPQSFGHAAGVGLSAGSTPNINPSANAGASSSGPSKSVGELLGSSPKKVMPDLGTGVGLSTSSGASASGATQPGTSSATPSQPTKSVSEMLGVKPVESPKPLSYGVGLSTSNSKASKPYVASTKPNTGVGRSLGIQPEEKPKPDFNYGVGLSQDHRPATRAGVSKAQSSESFSLNKAMGIGAQPAASQSASESSRPATPAAEAKPQQLGLSLEEKRKKDQRHAIIQNQMKKNRAAKGEPQTES